MINIANNSRAYSEVYSFLNTLGREYISKIPGNIYMVIEKYRDKSFNPVYSINQTVTSSTFSKEALALISAINLQFFCENEEEKQKLKEIYKKNGEIEKEKYSLNNRFAKQQENISIKQQETEKIEVQLTEYKKRNWIQKLIDKILNRFKK